MQKSNTHRKTNSKGGGRAAPSRPTSSIRAVAAVGAEPTPASPLSAPMSSGAAATPGLMALLSLSDELAAVTPVPAAERPAVPAHLAKVALELAARSRWAPVAERLADMGPSLLPPGTVDRLERAARATEHLLSVEPGEARLAPGVQAEADGIERRFKKLITHYFEDDADAKPAMGPGGPGYTKLGERITSMRAFLGPHQARLSKDEVAYRAEDFERAPVVCAALAAAGASPVPAQHKAWEDELGRVLRVLLSDERLVRLALQHALALLPEGSRLPRLRKPAERKVGGKVGGKAGGKVGGKAKGAEAGAKAGAGAETDANGGANGDANGDANGGAAKAGAGASAAGAGASAATPTSGATMGAGATSPPVPAASGVHAPAASVGGVTVGGTAVAPGIPASAPPAAPAATGTAPAATGATAVPMAAVAPSPTAVVTTAPPAPPVASAAPAAGTPAASATPCAACGSHPSSA